MSEQTIGVGPVLVRPQPLGAMAWPAGMLVIPDVDGAKAFCESLIIGAEPEQWPEGLAFVRAALDDDPERAAALVVGDDPVAHYNRAVLVGGDARWDEMRALSGGLLGALAATALFSVGLSDVPAEVTDGVDGEIAAVVRSARASWHLEQGDLASALKELSLAAGDAASGPSPVFEATLRSTLAEILRTQGDDPEGAIEQVDQALAGLPVTGPTELRAELHLTRALARHVLSLANPTQLTAVIADLHDALRTFSEQTHPEAFAVCNQQLALAYLAMPMNERSDRIRVGAAVSALRAALRVYQPDTHPYARASAQLNLANALQYLPSAHQDQNLDEAVQIYEELLLIRDLAVDPLGTARILANQGNALGHLGVFEAATERLERARELFARERDLESADEVQRMLAGMRDAQLAAGSSRVKG
ncbi:MAG TPA: tetratricopeptide repeat protein [Acidimicrobiales bacterium]|nr:tetratricopeptide repeat protein [Acidimicrobiales bacterium]